MRSLLTGVLFLMLGSATVSAQDAPAGRSRFIVTADVNYSYRLAETPDGLTASQKEYVDGLKSGMSYDISAYYRFNEQTSFGLKYSAFKSSGSLSDQDVIAPNGESGISDISDDVTISFYGVTALHDFASSGPHHGYVEGGLGYVHYNNDTHVIDNYTITGGSIGFFIGASYQFMAFEGFSIGPKVTVYTGTVGELDVEGDNGFNGTIELEDDNRESLNRLDLGIQAMYRF